MTRPAHSSPHPVRAPGPGGVDVSSWNGRVNWAKLASGGTRFAYIKATEGNRYTSSTFTQQYNAAHRAGLIRGAYTFANPAASSGSSQASYFVAHGGRWVPGTRTLPGVLDLENNPYGHTCYGHSPRQMISWIASFTTQYKKLTHRAAIIYTTTSWWNQCTGRTTRFNTSNALWIARYASTPGTLPGHRRTYTLWQHTDTPLDRDWFNGTITKLTNLARGTATTPRKHQPKRVPRPAHLRTLHQGMSGPDVKYAQQLLNLTGAHIHADSHDGPVTVAAIKTFQHRKHLNNDGTIGPITWSHLQAATGQ